MKLHHRIFTSTITVLGCLVLFWYSKALNGKRKFLPSEDAFGKVLTSENGVWYVEDENCQPRDNFVRAQLKWEESPTIFVYPTSIDKWVSGRIINEGKWEEHHIQRIHRILRSDPSMIFLDIGSNVGAFSLTMAELGNPVIAVDALRDNTARLCASMEINHLQNKISIIHNVLSFKREKVSLGKFYLNVGGTFVKHMGASAESDSIVIDAILLDDLLEIYRFKGRVVIKMDVESFEANVLRGAYKFFNHVNVDFILIEFMAHRGKESGDFIVKFLKQFGLEPEFSNGNHSSWPIDVWFMRPDKLKKNEIVLNHLHK
ncbi:uncharacterized protein LOC133188685 [Saccostrea echinata]|uniref:uncharacterized protein LOC133188685 n=1 Tax=Saccostrea echinata TaxID=191078 RepID=UPI002A8069A5|nr:uncharacterized protein LOC133188685 [Saccostrea echinata]